VLFSVLGFVVDGAEKLTNAYEQIAFGHLSYFQFIHDRSHSSNIVVEINFLFVLSRFCYYAI
jgi:hypothetical protein